MNKKVISIEIIGLFAILLIFIFVFFNDNTKKSGGYEEIKSMIDNKEDILRLEDEVQPRTYRLLTR